LFPTIEQNRAHILAQLDLALAQRPDLVCLPEEFATASVAGSAEERAETVPGPTVDAVAERARHGRCYIVCPLLTRREDGAVYNSAVVIGRSGEIIGIYDKRQPVTSSSDYTVLEKNIRPGTSDGIFDLDFGRIGIRICFDIGFPEDWEQMARQGARLVLWPSAYHGGRALAAYALMHHYYVVTAVRTDHSRILDPFGTLLAETDRLLNVAVRDINLDYAVCHYDFNFSIPDRILARYGARVEIRSQEDDGRFLVEPTDPEVTTAHLREEFGFETVQQYLERHRNAHTSLRDGGTPAPQSAVHGDRAMYAK
jgi:predicted amidohydrolase